MKVIEQRAKEKDAPLQFLHANEIDRLKDVKVGLAGVHQQYNALTAIELCRIWLKKCRNVELTEPVPQEFRAGLEKVVWPGRGQRLAGQDTKYKDKANRIMWYLDGAHTAESLRVCANWFKDVVQEKSNKNDMSRVLVFNCTNGRDGPHLLDEIIRVNPDVHFDHVIFTTNMTFRQGYTAGKRTNCG